MKICKFFKNIINEDNRTSAIDRSSYIEKRLTEQIQWYDNKSKKAQKGFKFFTICTLIFNSLIPIIVIFSDTLSFEVKIVTTSLSSIICIFSSLIQLNKYQENWLKYRTICENLIREKIFFETKCGDYKNCTDPEELLIITCENLMSNERKDWLNINSKNRSSQNQSASNYSSTSS
ncbi:DUF4231 domain-containing protein [Clostridium beijerinckii]|uniref:DUF4231 domain-containing protein n=1 Tax=Clostridium beijerinckii TaxID=1520 RepID=A0AAX0B695_CLOBE|nr:DUF4231 domain-containing protein [Clostridium beijerinckii]NRT90900.1 hypothetical protein [Clostridium beijerinckii]NYC70426.1 hypothetical protein [Clostridium beijerinckii]